MTYRGVWDDAPTTPTGPGRERRRPRRTSLLAGAIALLMLAGFGVVNAVALRPAAPSATAARRFVPPDGLQPMAAWTVDGTRHSAMVDNARLNGFELINAMPATTLTYSLTPQTDVAHRQWWRTGIIVGDSSVPIRYRYRSVTDRGVSLWGQAWGTLGLTFGPALLELPADVHAGATWHSSGRALAAPTSVQLYYDNTSSAVRAPAPYGQHGCLRVDSTTRLHADGKADEIWQEHNTWCPRRGLVASTGSWRGTAWTLSEADGVAVGRLHVSALETQAPRPAGAASWRQGRVTVLGGDDTFGPKQLSLTDSPLLPAPTTAHNIGLVNAASGDLSQLAELNDGKSWWLYYWARAGDGSGADAGGRSRIVSLTALGQAIVAGTTDRVLTCYLQSGRRAWSTRLDEVAMAAPVRVSPGRIAVATLAGSIYLLDATNGSVVWRHHTQHGFSLPLASDGKVVVGMADDGQIVVLDAASGDLLWSYEDKPLAARVAVVDGVVVVGSYGGADGRDASTGQLRWSSDPITGADGVVAGAGQVAVPAEDAVVGLEVATGAVAWRVDGASSPLRLADHWLMVVGDRLVLIDAGGRQVRQWPLRAGVARRQLAVGGNRVWVFGDEDYTLDIEWVGLP